MSARYISLVPKRKRMRVDNFVNLSPCLRISVDSSVWKKKKRKSESVSHSVMSNSLGFYAVCGNPKSWTQLSN